jgi:hypothetical protein
MQRTYIEGGETENLGELKEEGSVVHELLLQTRKRKNI